MCEECSTRVDGILRCRACVTAGTTEVRPRRVAWRSARAVLPALVLAPLAWGAVGWGLYGLARAVAAAAAAVEQAEEFLFEMAEF